MAQKWELLSIESLAELTANTKAPCLSLYQPTHRRHPENQQDLIRFHDLVRELETTLEKQNYPSSEIQLLLAPFQSIANDHDFWSHTLEGLAVLHVQGLFRVFRLPRPVAELALVSDSFHTKPLRRFLQSVDRYQILGLSLGKIRLFEGDRDALVEIELAAGVPHTITEALGDEVTHESIASDGGESAAMRHGRGGVKDEADIEADRFFRAVDRAILEHHSRPTGLPLILAALPEHHHLFHEVSHNPFLADAAITTNPDDLTIDELRQRAWEVVATQFQEFIAKLVSEFEEARSKQLGSDDFTQAALAAAAGRVESLLVEADRQLAGRLDCSTGQIMTSDTDQWHYDDPLDDLCELVEKKGGRVVVVLADQMPCQTGLAATYRY